MFQGFDGLLSLSRREGVDIRPTLLRVLTDLYVQTAHHSYDEELQFVELASRLLDQVDDATRAVVRARLSVYPRTPHALLRKLALPQPRYQRMPLAPPLQPVETQDVVFVDDNDLEFVDAPEIATAEPTAGDLPAAEPAPVAPVSPPTLAMKPEDASSLNDMFLAAPSKERAKILMGLESAPLKPSIKVDPKRAARALAKLEQAALAADMPGFIAELGDALILPAHVANAIVHDPLGEPLACAAKVLGMTGDAFQRVLLFLNPAIGSSVMDVYRLARMYDHLGERAALIMLATWRGASIATTRAKYRPSLYDDERHRARPAAAHHPAAAPAAADTTRFGQRVPGTRQG
jgi:hypothetical protein